MTAEGMIKNQHASEIPDTSIDTTRPMRGKTFGPEEMMSTEEPGSVQPLWGYYSTFHAIRELPSKCQTAEMYSPEPGSQWRPAELSPECHAVELPSSPTQVIQFHRRNLKRWPARSGHFSWAIDSESKDFVVEHSKKANNTQPSGFARQEQEEDFGDNVIERPRTPIAELTGKTPEVAVVPSATSTFYRPPTFDHNNDPPGPAFARKNELFTDWQEYNPQRPQAYRHMTLPPRPYHHIILPAVSSTNEKSDLYIDPSPIQRVTSPTLVETGFQSRTTSTSQRQSGAWSDECEERQDAVEWQKTKPKLKLLVPDLN